MIAIFLESVNQFFSAVYSGLRLHLPQDKDKRKLMFVSALAFASINHLPEIQLWKSTETLKGVLRWSVLPIISAVSIAVFSSLLKLKNFDKIFKIFLFTLIAPIIMINVQLPANHIQPLLFQTMAVSGIQAMEKKEERLKVSTKNTDDFIEASFDDTEIGIKKLFTPFFITKAQRMGIDIAICKRFVESHNGGIRVESEEAKGSIFTVVLPIHRGVEV